MAVFFVALIVMLRIVGAGCKAVNEAANTAICDLLLVLVNDEDREEEEQGASSAAVEDEEVHGSEQSRQIAGRITDKDDDKEDEHIFTVQL